MARTEKFGLHTKDYLQGISQALFFKNAYFGAALLALFILFSYKVFLCGVFASLVGYFYSNLYRTPKILKQNGLITINGFFFGVAFASLFQLSDAFYFCLVLGALALPLVTKAAFEILQHWKLSPLIVPYIFTIWIFWLSASGISLYPDVTVWNGDHSLFSTFMSETNLITTLLESSFYSMGEIFFFHNSSFGLGLLALIAAFSPRKGIYFLIGTLVSTFVFFSVSKGDFSWQYTFFSCSAGLVSLGLAAMPEKFSWRTIMLFCTLSLFLTMALVQLFSGFQLPILSLPFVLTFWFAILSRAPRLNINWAPTEVLLE